MRARPSKFDASGNEPERKKRRSGRPEDDVKTEAFLKAMVYLEVNDEEQITISELVEKMRENLYGDLEPYSKVYMKKKVVETLWISNCLFNCKRQTRCCYSKRKCSRYSATVLCQVEIWRFEGAKRTNSDCCSKADEKRRKRYSDEQRKL